MLESEFEKQVREQMEELKLSPSASVWEKVEEELREKKRRRVIVFIILLAGLGLLGSLGYYAYQPRTEKLSVKEASITKENSVTNASQETPVDEKHNHETTGDRSQQNSSDEVKDLSNTNTLKIVDTPVTALTKEELKKELNKSTATRATNQQQPKKQALINVEQGKAVAAAVPKSRKTKSKKPVTTAVAIPVTATNSKDGLLPPVASAEAAKNTEPSPTVTQTGKELKNTDSLTQQKDTTLATKQPVVDTVAAVSAKPPAGIKKTRWAIELSTGLSNVHDHAFLGGLGFGAMYADAASVGTPQNGGISNGAAGVPPPPAPASPVRANIAFRVGVSYEKQISRKSTVGIGLSYAYMSTRIEVGQNDSLNAIRNNSQYFLSLSSNASQHISDFTNKYHFIMLPLSYQLQLNKNNRLPFLWNLNLVPGFMVGTNGLVYNPQASVYYYDKDAFNRFHLNMGTGFAFRFGNNKPMQWTLGPELMLDMSRLLKDESKTKQYLFYGGITSRLYFQKRNK